MPVTAVERVFNFSAGPAVLPEPVLEEIQRDLVALPGVGSSILEISHRSQDFVVILHEARQLIRELLAVPADYEILFLQGGARLQNAMIPMNLMTDSTQTADYILTGSWGKKSAEEVSRFGNLNIAWQGTDENFSRVPADDQLSLTDGAAYVHYTSNETIQGVQFSTPPQVAAPLVVDCSSDFLSRPMEVEKFGLIYACAQKNAGAAGLTVVIIRKDLVASGATEIPTMLQYRTHAGSESMYNTPPTFGIYIMGLVFKWLKKQGGLDAIQKQNEAKAGKLYQYLDQSQLFQATADADSRSLMNVTFVTGDADLDAKFISAAKEAGLDGLKGHRSVGGCRASIYNAVGQESVDALVAFMKDFQQANG